MTASDSATEAASLADAVLDAEAERQAEHADQEIVFADDLLPGVGDEALTLRQGLAIGGSFTFVMLLLLTCVENLESGTLSVLAPDIRDSFGVSDGVIVFISAAAGSFLVLGSLPMGWLADRYKRPPIIAISTAVFSVFVFFSGLAFNAFTLFIARFGVGIAQVRQHHRPPRRSSPTPTRSVSVAGSAPRPWARASSWPPSAPRSSAASRRWRAAATGGGGRSSCSGIPALALVAGRVPDPRGAPRPVRDEGRARRGHRRPARADVDRVRVRSPQADPHVAHACWSRSPRSASGSSPGRSCRASTSKNAFGLDAFERGLLGSLGGLCDRGHPALRSAGLRRPLPRRTLRKALRLVGLLILPVAIAVPIQYAMPNAWLFAIFGVVPQVLLLTAFTMVGPITAVDRALPPSGHGCGIGVDLRVLHRRDRRCSPLRLLRRRHRPQPHGAAARWCRARSSVGC